MVLLTSQLAIATAQDPLEAIRMENGESYGCLYIGSRALTRLKVWRTGMALEETGVAPLLAPFPLRHADHG